MSNSRIYLDNAATSWPKPNSVYDAVDHYQRSCGVPYGRGGYKAAAEVGRTIDQLRVQIASLVKAKHASNVLFTYSGTDSLNLGIHGIVRAGDHVVTSLAEHNSVLRPLRYLEATHNVEVTRVAVNECGIVNPGDVIDAIRPNTRLVVAIHASNVTGAIYDLAPIGQFCQRSSQPPFFLVDAAQSIGHIPVDVAQLGCDMLAAPGHKGLLGPTGTGVLYVSDRAYEELQPYRQGGTGTQSETDEQPTEPPARFESGNHNVPGLVGLAAGIEYIQQTGLSSIRKHEIHLMTHLRERLQAIPHVSCFGPASASACVGVLSFNVANIAPQDIASILDSTLTVQCRAGLHCAAMIHKAMGTFAIGGTVRLSVGPYSTVEQLDAVADLLEQLG
ncbi:MAG: aminotransferase class V-fold PLP-dependent enzyme [Planctomycetales bacterium]|nr:aminotransferase class V-fold PLP-dependent enzyme [Planctomycetales bacterium]